MFLDFSLDLVDFSTVLLDLVQVNRDIFVEYFALFLKLA